MKRIFILLSVCMSLVLVGCDSDVEPGGTKVEKLSNEWWGQIYVPDGSGGLTDVGVGYQHYMTYSTASNLADSIFVDDFNGLLQLKAKVACNTGAMSFSSNGTAVRERYTDETVTISNGKIITNGAHSTSGVQVDSIYFEAEFSWEPGQVYIIAGHGRTGFNEDEH